MYVLEKLNKNKNHVFDIQDKWFHKYNTSYNKHTFTYINNTREKSKANVNKQYIRFNSRKLSN